MDKDNQAYEFPDALLIALQKERGEDPIIPPGLAEKRLLLRKLMNIRLPGKLDPELAAMQDMELTRQKEEKGVVDAAELPPIKPGSKIKLWRGDITRLNADAIVNAANSQLLGCFSPLHNCIDNVIHSAAGSGLREECGEIMARQGHAEETGSAKITRGYNLPAKWVIHTVGPIVSDKPDAEDERALSSCYTSSLELADRKKLKSIAFCCISTGVFGYPNEDAAKTAIAAVSGWLEKHPDTSIETVIFNVFKAEDFEIYNNQLNW